MDSMVNQEKQLPQRGLKQVKVDNWGTFFLQRLQQLYFDEELLDLTIKFPTSDITVQAHRLVITTCTDYFVQLEKDQKEKDENFDGIIIMPPDMPYECVKSIISFMYTGQLEYWTSEQHALYRTAQKMNMTVLTKLLDAQFNTSALQSEHTTKSSTQPALLISKPTTGATKTTVTTNASSGLTSQPLPGRKLPIWKRKLDMPPSGPVNHELRSYGLSSLTRPTDLTPGPSRFDLPEADDIALGVFSSFDDITYNTKPIVQASDKYKGDHSPVRKGSPDRGCKNDTTEDEEDENHVNEKSLKEVNSDDDWSSTRNYQRSQDSQPSPVKKVRFDLGEKENLEKKPSRSSAEDSINNHAKIIREVLKKYPHLVKNNKNIRLKIMQKEAKSENGSASKTKVSYVVLKSDHLLASNNGEDNDSKCNGNADGETGPWKCNKCDLEEEYTNYYMYRRHMQDVHEEKFDPRVCEHCGYKATKRNILMYHLYTKHNVPPPKSMHFPKCQSCSYVALSETLLVRHQINHNHRPSSRQHAPAVDEIQCGQCSQTFKDVNELTTHEINTGHNLTDGKKRGHHCQYCGKVFVRAQNLEVHLKCMHKNLRDTDNIAAHEIQCSQCSQTFKDVNKLTAHEINSGHVPTEGKRRGHRCPHCGMVFVRAPNLQIHLNCVHRDLRDTDNTASMPSISLEPSSEAEALSHVASGIATSLSVGDNVPADSQEVAVTETEYIIPEMNLNNMTYTTQEIDGRQMIMLIDNGHYQQQETGDQEQQLQQQPQQLDITGDQQIVMQGTENGMIVYIHGNEETDRQSYGHYQSEEMEQESEEMEQESEEIVEEVVEEVEEEVMETDEQGETEMLEEECAVDQVEEVIQYVEEQTEIVEYEQAAEQSDSRDRSQAVMIIEEEHVAPDEESDKSQQEKSAAFNSEWDDDSRGLTES